MAAINYSASIPRLPDDKETVLNNALDARGIDSILITSTFRNPEDQAEAMYNNIVSFGIDPETKLYSPGNGDQVIEVYKFDKDMQCDKSDIIADMAAKIRELGPETVSAHCTNDPEKLVAYDILPASVTPASKKNDFIAAMQSITSRFLIPGITTGEPVYHAEMRGPLPMVLCLLIAGALYFFYKNLK